MNASRWNRALPLVVLLTGATIGSSQSHGQDYGSRVEAPLFEMIDIGDFGGPSSMALDIDEQGRVVGEAETHQQDRHAYLWSLGTRGLAALPATGSSSSGWALNEQGLVVGYARDRAWHFRPVLWQAGAMHDLGTLGGPEGFALDVNADGVIVGVADSEPWGHPRAFVFDGAMSALPTPGDAYGAAFGINDAGTIVGRCGMVDGEHAMFWRRDAASGTWIATDLHPTLGVNSAARAINEHGDIVGWAQHGQPSPAAGFYRAHLWLAVPVDGLGAVQDLDTLPGMRTSSAFALNNHREVVGTTSGEYASVDRAFYWSRATGLVDLNDLVMNRDGRVMIAGSGINDAGDIVGYALDQGAPRAVYLRRARPAQ